MRTYSILRTKEDEVVSSLRLTGHVIDLGGHRGSSYFSRLVTETPVEVANFDDGESRHHKNSSGADHFFDLEKNFPLPDETYNAVLCLNVLEHIYNHKNLLSESYRILKPQGAMYLSVPFFFNIHGSPNDYFRYTKEALRRLFSDAGFRDIDIVTLGDGPASAIFQTFGGNFPTFTLKLFLMRVAISLDRALSRISLRYAAIRERIPLGYFVSAYKR